MLEHWLLPQNNMRLVPYFLTVLCFVREVQVRHLCRYPKGNKGDVRTEGCLVSVCKTAGWLTSINDETCCHEREAHQPGTTMATVPGADGCSSTHVVCQMEEGIARTFYKHLNECQEPEQKWEEFASNWTNILETYLENSCQQDDPTTKECPTGWSRYGLSCYRAFTKDLNWGEAQAECQKQNSNLAISIKTGINNFIKGLKPNDKMWLGGFRQPGSSPNNGWHWVNSNYVWNFEDWSSGEPNGADELCLVQLLGSRGWSDYSCFETFGFVCEQPSSECHTSCDANKVVLSDSPQWEHEEGYWIGEYSLYGADGNSFISSSWNYPYNHYRGFITGNVQGNAYVQRNVFMYPPQDSSLCPGSSPVGDGECGTNGNMKVFEADQRATTCSNNPELKGDIEGPYGSLSYTYTELIGKDNSLLYQVWLPKDALNYYQSVILGNPGGVCVEGDCGYTGDRLMQSQLTTLTKQLDGTWLRTRTAQGFDAFGNVGDPTYASYYREKTVTKAVFWTEFDKTMKSYNILESDACACKTAETGGTAPSGLDPGFMSCQLHLESSFDLTGDGD